MGGGEGKFVQPGSKDRLKLSQIMAYAAPAMPISALGLPLIVHLPAFYVSIVGLPVALVGLVFMIVRFWDVLTDPLMGWAADRFQTRWGKRRAWIVASVPILILSAWMIFMPPENAGWTYLLFWMLLLYIGWTMLTISHLSWGAELSDNYHQRSRVQGIREVFVITGMLLTLTLPIMVEYFGENGSEAIVRMSVAAMGWFIIIFLPITALVAVLSVGEAKSFRTKISWRESAQAFLSNRPLRFLLGTDFVLGFSLGVVSSMFFFLIEDVLALERWVANAMLFCYLFTGIVFVPFFVWLANRFGKHYAQFCSSGITFITLPVVLIVPPEQAWAALLAWMILGVNMAAGPILLRSMMADVCDEDQVQSSGNSRMGLFYALLTMTTKSGQAVAIGTVYPLLGWMGFAHGGDNSEALLWQMRWVYVVLPVVMNLIAMKLMWSYPLTQEKQQHNRQKIDVRV